MLTDPRRVRVAVTTAAALTAALTTLTGPAEAAAGPRAAFPSRVEVQYSDVPSAALVTTTTATAGATGLPAGTSLGARTTSGADGTFRLTGATTADPGTYPAVVSATDAGSTTQVATTFVVTPERATVAYTGPTAVAGGSWEDEEVPVTLRATVSQDADGSLGDLTRAAVTFTDGEDDLCAAPVDASGQAVCTTQVDTSLYLQVSFDVVATVEGAFAGTSSPVRVVVTLPDEEEDLTAPQTTLTSAPDGWWLQDGATFGYASSEADSDFSCRFDKEPLKCKGSSVSVSKLKPGSHRFEVTAEDDWANEDETPAVAQFAVPYDDSALAGKGWRTRKSGAAYGGSYREARKKGATLSYQVSGARELALLVTGKGKVQVFLGAKSLGVVKAGKGGKAATLLSSAQPVSGVLKVVSMSRRPVGVDGLGVSTASF